MMRERAAITPEQASICTSDDRLSVLLYDERAYHILDDRLPMCTHIA